MLKTLKQTSPYLIPVFLFLILFTTGIFFSNHKPLWNDEIHTATSSLPRCSYTDILKGTVPGEANNFPLYYLIQKAFMAATDFHLSQQWHKEHFMFDDTGQWLLRIPSNICFALTLSLVLFFFLRRNDAFTGTVYLLCLLSSFMTWTYWMEARPYALWYSLAIIHSVFLLRAFEKDRPQHYRGLTYIHWLLALTSFVSVVQIVMANILIWLRTKNLKPIIPLSLPLLAIVFYKWSGMPITPRLEIFGPFLILFTAVPPEWLAIITLAGTHSFLMRKDLIRQDLFLFLFFLGMLLAGCGILFTAWLNHTPKPDAPAIYYRHLIFITPYAALLIAQIFRNIWEHHHKLWPRINIILLITALLITNGLRTITLLYEHITFVF